jgi:hypothetical protein
MLDDFCYAASLEQPEVDTASGLRITADAAKKEQEILLNAGRGACASLQIAGDSNVFAIGLTKKLELVPGLVADSKQSAARDGARTTLTLAKAHYPEMTWTWSPPASQRAMMMEHRWMKPPSGRACWDMISCVP